MVVQTSAPSLASTRSSSSAGLRVVTLVGFVLFLIPRGLRRFRKGWLLLLVILAICAAGAAVTGCSGPRSLTGGTPLGAQTIVVIGTATDGSQTLNHQTTVTLNVKSLF